MDEEYLWLKIESQKIKLKMLMPQEKFVKLLDVYFAIINWWKTGKYVPTIKVRKNYNHNLKSLILRWMNNGY